MEKPLRYGLYSFIFLLCLVGLLSHTDTLLVTSLVVAILLGLVVDRWDNLRDEPFKMYNVKHGHIKSKEETHP